MSVPASARSEAEALMGAIVEAWREPLCRFFIPKLKNSRAGAQLPRLSDRGSAAGGGPRFNGGGIPGPARYAFHKLIVAQERPVSEHAIRGQGSASGRSAVHGSWRESPRRSAAGLGRPEGSLSRLVAEGAPGGWRRYENSIRRHRQSLICWRQICPGIDASCPELQGCRELPTLGDFDPHKSF